ncbi:MAG TPA: biotin/lipoyl-binding protein, partial [Sphingomonas sp.]|nr:biotin/lipoyl-binding protein [Sphingomonas sp.]
MSLIRNALPAVALLSLAACGQSGQQQPGQGAPPPVGYVIVREQPVTLTSELPGRTTAYETSDVRPQVNGIITARLFQEGDMVSKGQPLYRIDPAPYQAQVANARAALAKAQAAI